MAEACTLKWKKMKNRSFACLPPDAKSLHQHCLRANYLACLVLHSSLKCHPSPLEHDWKLVGGCCYPVHHTKPADLPVHLYSTCTRASRREREEDESEEENEEEEDEIEEGDEEEEDDEAHRRRENWLEPGDSGANYSDPD